MNVRHTMTLSAVALAIVGISSTAFAAREFLTKNERKCQKAFGKAMATFAAGREKCIAKCHAKTPNGPGCAAPYGFDTGLCVGKLQNSTYAKLLKRCPDVNDACPSCYVAASGSCNARAVEEINFIGGSLVDVILGPAIFCNDAMSGGLTGDEAKCRTQVAKGFGQLGNATDKCLGKCLERERASETNGSCDNKGYPANLTDTETMTCLTDAIAKVQSAAAKACADDYPECWGDTPAGIVDTLAPFAVSAGYGIAMCPVCGDGIAEGLEECEPPTMCVGGPCTAQCQCP